MEFDIDGPRGDALRPDDGSEVRAGEGKTMTDGYTYEVRTFQTVYNNNMKSHANIRTGADTLTLSLPSSKSTSS